MFNGSSRVRLRKNIELQGYSHSSRLHSRYVVPLKAVLKVDYTAKCYVCRLVVILKVKCIPDLKRAANLLTGHFYVNAVFSKHQDVVLAASMVQLTHECRLLK